MRETFHSSSRTGYWRKRPAAQAGPCFFRSPGGALAAEGAKAIATKYATSEHPVICNAAPARFDPGKIHVTTAVLHPWDDQPAKAGIGTLAGRRSTGDFLAEGYRVQTSAGSVDEIGKEQAFAKVIELPGHQNTLRPGSRPAIRQWQPSIPWPVVPEPSNQDPRHAVLMRYQSSFA